MFQIFWGVSHVFFSRGKAVKYQVDALEEGLVKVLPEPGGFPTWKRAAHNQTLVDLLKTIFPQG